MKKAAFLVALYFSVGIGVVYSQMVEPVEEGEVKPAPGVQVSGDLIEKHLQHAEMLINRPGGLRRYVENVLKSGIGVENLPSGTATVTVATGVFTKLFSEEPEHRSLYLRTLTDPWYMDFAAGRQQGPIAAEAPDMAASIAQYRLKDSKDSEKVLTEVERQKSALAVKREELLKDW